MNSHGGNRVVSKFIADRINHETSGIAVELGEAAAPFMKRTGNAQEEPPQFDRHGGVRETSSSLYLISELVNLNASEKAILSMPEHLNAMVPHIMDGDETALRVFLAEALKSTETGKGTSAREMTTTGVWSERHPRDATAEQGRGATDRFVKASVAFIKRWNELRPAALKD